MVQNGFINILTAFKSALAIESLLAKQIHRSINQVFFFTLKMKIETAVGEAGQPESELWTPRAPSKGASLNSS